MSFPAPRAPIRRHKHPGRLAVLWLSLILALVSPVARAETNAWARTDAYVAPDFERYFPDDSAAGWRLDELARTGQFSSLPAEEAISAMRAGFRAAHGHRLTILREFGNRFIWGKSPQNAAAIELMYHAAGYERQPDPESTRHFAIYFGLSVVEPKPANVLRALADLAVGADDPNLLDRVAWGVRTQRAACLAFLEPHLNSSTNTVREHAMVVQKILRGELKAFPWARERDRQKALAAHSADLPRVRGVLANGSPEERWKVFQEIDQNHLALIMDDSFLPAFAACARDGGERVRSLVARVVGENWIWQAREQSAEAIQLLLSLSRDPDREVRHAAIYFGLSTVRAKSDEVIRCLLELALGEDEEYHLGRIKWGLASEKEKVAEILADYTSDADPQKAARARKLSQDWRADGQAKKQPARAPDQPGWRAALLQRLALDFQPFQIQLTGEEPVNIRRREVIAVGEQSIIVVEAGDRIRQIEFGRVTGLQDLPRRR